MVKQAATRRNCERRLGGCCSADILAHQYVVDAASGLRHPIACLVVGHVCAASGFRESPQAVGRDKAGVQSVGVVQCAGSVRWFEDCIKVSRHNNVFIGFVGCA